MSAARLSTGAPDWVGRTVCVAGIGVSGRAAAGALLRLGAEVTVVDGRSGPDELAHAEALTELGAKVLLGEGERVPHGTQAVVTSPGWRPAAPLLASARRAGVPVLGEVELAWLLRRAGGRSGA
ncbi:MAG: UDP-N-acetylmuramoyl-L-alanine--D-glutamate ligase, partial [Streptomycetales bacterium]